MKRIILLLATFSFTFYAFAQDEQSNKITDKGTFSIDANTTVGSIGGMLGSGGTNFLLTSSDGTTIWNIGAEMGYFFQDDFAGKLGFGFGDYDGTTVFSYKLGLKYYIIGSVPVQLDFSGQSSQDFWGDENPSYLGMQAGYAAFIGSMVSVEPTLRYNLALNDLFENMFQVQVGFTLFF